MYGVVGRLDLLNRWLLLEFADDRGRGTTFETGRGWGRVIKVHLDLSVVITIHDVRTTS